MTPAEPRAAPHCTNCGAPRAPDAAFCARCGQKTYGGPPTMWELFSHFFETVFNLDNRLFRTLAALAIPGRLTNYFLAGRQRPYFHPLRLFFVAGVLMIATYSFVATEAIGDTLDEEVENRRDRAYQSRYRKLIGLTIDTIQEIYPDPVVTVATDSLLRRLHLRTIGGNNITYLAYKGGLTFENKRIDFEDEDFVLMTPNEVVEKYEVKGFVNRYQVKQLVSVNRLGVKGVGSLMGQLIWGFVLLVPIAAFLLQIIYFRHKRKYVEHFIFSLHVHAFLFLTQFLGALELYFFGTPVLVIASLVGTLAYFLLSLRRVYHQGWGKTALKAFLLAFLYFVLLQFAIFAAGFIAFLLF